VLSPFLSAGSVRTQPMRLRAPARCVSPHADDRMHMGMQLKATLQALGARALVVGHTPQMTGVNCECEGLVWRVDVGMSSGVLNAEPQVLEFRRDREGRLVASRLCSKMNGIVATEFVYADAKGMEAA
jgi:hypothetical protein